MIKHQRMNVNDYHYQQKNALASDVYQPILWVRLENGSMVTPVFATPILTISGLA